jgi:Polyketide cyclase / dehydrase and lipid transport
MADWTFEHSAESGAPPPRIWERYTDVEQWRQWSKGVEESTLEGEFEVGSKGVIKPPQLPKSRFELVEVEPERSFASQAKLPGATLRLDHLIERANGGSRITHTATVSGLLAPVWAPVVSRIIKRELPAGVERLAELAVEKEEEERKEAAEEEERKAKLKKADEEFRAEIEKTSRGEGDRGGASLPGA